MYYLLSGKEESILVKAIGILEAEKKVKEQNLLGENELESYILYQSTKKISNLISNIEEEFLESSVLYQLFKKTNRNSLSLDKDSLYMYSSLKRKYIQRFNRAKKRYLLIQ